MPESDRWRVDVPSNLPDRLDMAGVTTIQRYPKGLLDFLGMKGTGDAAHEIAQQLVPTLEQTDFYLQDRLTYQLMTPGIAIPGVGMQSFALSAVPDGFIRLIVDLSMRIPTVAAGASVRCHLVAFRGTGSTYAVALTEALNVGANESNVAGVHYQRPLIMLPGQGLGVQTTVYVGAPATTPELIMWSALIGI